VIDLGPGSGADGGQLVAQGPPASLERGATADALAGHPESKSPAAGR
jgi:excinuclease UvrABC ATPase subunit